MPGLWVFGLETEVVGRFRVQMGALTCSDWPRPVFFKNHIILLPERVGEGKIKRFTQSTSWAKEHIVFTSVFVSQLTPPRL